MNLVSVIIPTHNRSGAITKTIDSLLRQDYKKLEIIVVDDCSTDDTIKILEKYGKKIRLVKRKFNGGPAAARNDGLRVAKGKYVAFTDSDCTASSSWISKLVDFARKQPQHVAGVCGQIYPPKDASFLVNCIYFMPQMDGNTLLSEKQKLPFDVDNISCNNALWKADVIRRMMFDESFFRKFRVMPEDSELCYRAIKKGYRFIMVPAAQTYHHFRPTLWKFLSQSYNAGRGGGIVMMKHNDWFGDKTVAILAFPVFLLASWFFPALLALPIVLTIPSAINASRKLGLKYPMPVMMLQFVKTYINLFGIWEALIEYNLGRKK